jgi:hypothetical protein
LGFMVLKEKGEEYLLDERRILKDGGRRKKK